MISGAKVTQQKAINKWNSIEQLGQMQCKCCNEIKSLNLFSPLKSRVLSYKRWSSTCKECIRNYQNTWYEARNINLSQKIAIILKRTKTKYKKLGKQFDLTKKFILDLYEKQQGKCFYTGLDLLVSSDESNYHCLSIDRIDSSKGYTQDNVVLCCWIINRIKINLSVDEFVNYCKLVANNYGT